MDFLASEVLSLVYITPDSQGRKNVKACAAKTRNAEATSNTVNYSAIITYLIIETEMVLLQLAWISLQWDDLPENITFQCPLGIVRLQLFQK